MQSKIVTGFLSYIPTNLVSIRYNDFRQSLTSLSLLCSSTDLISIDNASIEQVKNEICTSRLFAQNFHYDQNFLDTGMFYTLCRYAFEHNYEFLMYTYDDFIIYDNAIDDCVDFLSCNTDVSCLRVTRYDMNKQCFFDSAFTSKRINPDSVRHYNYATRSKLRWSAKQVIGRHEFYKCNWHYTSRPCIWRTKDFATLLKSINSNKTLQQFEANAMNGFASMNSLVGVLDRGMMKTTKIENSARYSESSSDSICIDVGLLSTCYDRIVKPKEI